MCIVWFYNAIIQRCIIHELVEKAYIRDKEKCLLRLCNVSVSCVVLSSFGLPVLSIFSTAHPHVHGTAAKWFFCLETIALFTNVRLFPLVRCFRCSLCCRLMSAGEFIDSLMFILFQVGISMRKSSYRQQRYR